jgi:hypothetical protein
MQVLFMFLIGLLQKKKKDSKPKSPSLWSTVVSPLKAGNNFHTTDTMRITLVLSVLIMVNNLSIFLTTNVIVNLKIYIYFLYILLQI